MNAIDLLLSVILVSGVALVWLLFAIASQGV